MPCLIPVVAICPSGSQSYLYFYPSVPCAPRFPSFPCVPCFPRVPSFILYFASLVSLMSFVPLVCFVFLVSLEPLVFLTSLIVYLIVSSCAPVRTCLQFPLLPLSTLYSQCLLYPWCPSPIPLTSYCLLLSSICFFSVLYAPVRSCVCSFPCFRYVPRILSVHLYPWCPSPVPLTSYCLLLSSMCFFSVLYARPSHVSVVSLASLVYLVFLVSLVPLVSSYCMLRSSMCFQCPLCPCRLMCLQFPYCPLCALRPLCPLCPTWICRVSRISKVRSVTCVSKIDIDSLIFFCQRHLNI